MSVDLRTTYMGIELAHPIVPSASPLTGDLDSLRRLEEAGASAVVLPSLFEEQIEHEAIEMQRLMEFGSESFAEALTGYFPAMGDYRTGPGEYLQHVALAREALSIPVIASLNGTTRGGWVRYAKKLEDAGADGIELNVFLIPTDPLATAEDVEQRYLDLVHAVSDAVAIPLAVKVGPYFSSMANMARRLHDAGAAALVLFNRFYQPDIDLEALDVVSNLKLSDPVELRLPLRWVAILRGRVGANLAVTSGVHSAEDVVKSLLVGADAVMMASALLRHGEAHLAAVLEGTRLWLEEHEYESVAQIKGSMSQLAAPNPEAFVRSNYMKMLISYTSPLV